MEPVNHLKEPVNHLNRSQGGKNRFIYLHSIYLQIISTTRKLLGKVKVDFSGPVFPSERLSACGERLSPGSWWLSASLGAAGRLQCTALPGGFLPCGVYARATEAWHPGCPERGGKGCKRPGLHTQETGCPSSMPCFSGGPSEKDKTSQ